MRIDGAGPGVVGVMGCGSEGDGGVELGELVAEEGIHCWYQCGRSSRATSGR